MSDTPQKTSTAPQTRKSQRPEAVDYLLGLGLFVLGGEVVHQGLQVATSLFNRHIMVGQLSKSLAERGTEYPQAFMDLASYAAIAGTTMFSLLIIGLLAWMLALLRTPQRHSGTARRLWFAFSLYFTFRLLMVFLVAPAGADAPDWLYVLDGSVQILVGSAAAMLVYFTSKEDTLNYTGELEQLRKLEAEQRRELERRKEAARERNKRDKGDKRDKQGEGNKRSAKDQADTKSGRTSGRGKHRG
ncbi:hypothetical protein G7Y31_01455 [Corynebacterium lizhenjunii]|uniref:Uncharacterized protein n=1 Tax=Corynebacterium lizhenjunii TaxID=2709394 RepID=A0A7T0KEP7_9CORY|nr:hypothetical protein [Corynebacterium lizhenjunii]QPK79415.1 hypothetical protein G7Y31_01455 [Corynebacterium lizhenjunii]